MSRPKGSKNKPKLTTESVSAENAPTSTEQDSTCAKNATVETSNVSTKETTEPVKKKRHRRTKAEMEAYRASLKVQSTLESESNSEQLSEQPIENQDEINSKFKQIINILESKNTPTLSDRVTAHQESKLEINPEIKTNNLKNLEDLETQENQGIQESSKKKSKQIKSKSIYPLCDCCQQEIYCQPHRIDTNMISAQVADYHRESPRWVNLCSSCAKKLSDTVDKWLQENGCITRMEQRMLEKEKEKENS